MNRKWHAALFPCTILLSEVFVFYRRVLFSSSFVIPWDLPGYHLPLATYVAKSLRAGELPLWEPYTYCGFPFYANIGAQLFYPPALLTCLVSNLFGGNNLLYFLEWQVAGHAFLGGVFTYWLLRACHLDRAPALLGATIFQLGPFFASQTQHLGAVSAGAWLPLAWRGLIALRQRPTWRWAAVLAFSLAMAILAGFPAATAVVFGGSFLFAASMVALRRARLSLLVVFALACLWAGLLASAQLAPTMELARWSNAFRRAEWLGAGGGVPLQGLVSMVIPNHYQIFDLKRYSLPWNPTFLYLYCSLTGLLLSLAALVGFRKRKDCAVFALVTFLSALWMLGESTPVARTLFPLLPGVIKSSLYAEFAMVAFVLGVAGMAAMGAQIFILPRSRVLSALLVAVAAGELIAVGSGRFMNTGPVQDSPIATPDKFEGSPVTLQRMRQLANQTAPPSRIEIYQDSANWVTGAPVTEVPTPNGNDPLALARILQVRLCFAKGDPWTRYYLLSALDSPLVDLLNVRYLLSWAPSDVPLLRHPKFPKIDNLPGHHVYENRNVLPRFFLVHQVGRAKDLAEALAMLQAPGFDPRRMAIVEGPLDFADSAGLPAEYPVKVESYKPREVALEVADPSPSFLVTSETYYPGWRAFVDGQERPISLTNGAFRGLSVPAGHHRITMRFQPVIFWYGLAIGAAAWGFWLWAACYPKRALLQ